MGNKDKLFKKPTSALTLPFQTKLHYFSPDLSTPLPRVVKVRWANEVL